MIDPFSFFSKRLVINLADASKRFSGFSEEMLRLGVKDVDRFEAYPHDNEVNKLPHKFNSGADISHYKLVAMAKERGWENVFVFEDDFRARPNAYDPEIFLACTDYLSSNDWDFFNIGYMVNLLGIIKYSKQHKRNYKSFDLSGVTRLSEHLVQFDYYTLRSNTAVAYNHTSYDKILNNYDPLTDIAVDKWVSSNFKTIGTVPCMATWNSYHPMKHKKIMAHSDKLLATVT